MEGRKITLDPELFVRRLFELEKVKCPGVRPTQKTISARIGISENHLSAKKHGAEQFTLDDVLSAANAYGCGVDYLLGYTDDLPDIQAEKRLTFRDVARMLVAIDEGFHFVNKWEYVETSRAIDQNEGISYNTGKTTGVYKYVPLGLKPRLLNYKYRIVKKDEMTGDAFWDEVETSVTLGYVRLNEFLAEYFSLRNATKKVREDTKIFSKEAWKEFIEKALEAIPEDPAPYPLDEVEDSEPWIPEDLLENDSTTAPEDAPDPTPKQTTSQEKKTAPKKPKKKAD